MAPNAYALMSLESALRAAVETALATLLGLAVSALVTTAVAALALHVRRRLRVHFIIARVVKSSASVAAVMAALACAGSFFAANAQTRPAAVRIITTDYAYDAPDTVVSGYNVFQLVNHGDQAHAATIVRFEGGRTLADYIAAYSEAQRTRGARPTWARFLGGPGALLRGEANATVRLEPGNYAWICYVPDPDGVSHLLKHNQAHAFVVRQRTGERPAPRAPEPTASLRLLDYAFQLGAPLKPGKHVIRVENAGADYHHALLFKLAPGKNLDDFQAWLKRRMQGKEPSTFVGAIAEMSPGTEAFLELDLPAGEYVIVCLIDGRDEVPHVAKGMIQLIRIE